MPAADLERLPRVGSACVASRSDRSFPSRSRALTFFLIARCIHRERELNEALLHSLCWSADGRRQFRFARDGRLVDTMGRLGGTFWKVDGGELSLFGTNRGNVFKSKNIIEADSGVEWWVWPGEKVDRFLPLMTSSEYRSIFQGRF